ncbi:DUF2141 domain-containing protein [Massilia sp. Dwa41.01b]|uniref:DUF2141 domain-containing protein n=1 Tax=Massilia sp. Dwa41.01b TaxID=2709302 RepID=UPI0016032287|nr:DUF2141 domain-containing protein [Massilia sp. Dwa41.01b]QNA90191.1 DUF2141 domain-containing protein [Massilia sp. Dwa41.01b]
MLFRSALTWFLSCGLLANAMAGNVEVRVSGIKGARGKVNVAVCDKERFLKQCGYSASAPAGDGETIVTLKDVPAGAYAVLAYQDANDNDRLDRNPLGMPSERYGFSREARGKFGPPTFEKAAIEVGEALTVAPVKLR